MPSIASLHQVEISAAAVARFKQAVLTESRACDVQVREKLKLVSITKLSLKLGDLFGKTLFNRAGKDGTEDREKEHISG